MYELNTTHVHALWYEILSTHWLILSLLSTRLHANRRKAAITLLSMRVCYAWCHLIDSPHNI